MIVNFQIPLWNYNSITIIQQHLIIYVYHFAIADLLAHIYIYKVRGLQLQVDTHK